MNKDDGLCVANHVLDSILKDLAFLKDNSYLPEHTYRDVLATLPTRLTNNYNTTNNNNDYNNNNNVAKPPLPIRKSTSSSVSFPVPAPREASPSFPKLPTRRTNEWNSPAPAPAVIAPVAAVVAPVAAAAAAAAQEKAILHTEPQKVPPPPAYTPTTSLATAEALYDYAGEDPETDLSFKQGDVIEVTEYVNDDWWKGTVNGKTGIFPQNHVKKLPPSIKAKRPPAGAKPMFPNNSTPTLQTQQPMNNVPYSYPPPPTSMYQPPPSSTNYAQQSYAPPPVQQAYGNEEHQGQEGDGKVQNMAKKFGGKVGNAAVWGFGATLGSQAASAIF